jgi:hypothetical protein
VLENNGNYSCDDDPFEKSMFYGLHWLRTGPKHSQIVEL